jgi:hypothetical protein
VPGIRTEKPTSAAWWSWRVPGPVSGIALVTFIVLKLNGVITWSWWSVVSPIWISGILAVTSLCVLAVLVCWEAHRMARSWTQQFSSGQWLTEVSGRLTEPDASSGDLGFQDER